MVRIINLAVVILTAFCAFALAQETARQPVLDKQGRMVIYSNGKRGLRFIPYGYMPKEADQMIKMDLECKKDPYIAHGSKVTPEDTCIEVTIHWKPPYWAGVVWISGPEGWWGEDSRGWHYDLSGLKDKRLIFYARAPKPTSIQVKLGTLGDKPNGDSVQHVPATQWILLTPQWRRYELSFQNVSPSELKKVCSGFVFVVSKDQQPQDSNTTHFFLDEVFLK